MECNQKQASVAATGTLYENFIEEKCESDILIPDYYPAAEKIIQCNAIAIVNRKEIAGERLMIEGVCKFCIIYQGEEGEIKSLSENVPFSESFSIKTNEGLQRVQIISRVGVCGCRLLNSRKINAATTVSMAIKVTEQKEMPIIDSIACEKAESLFQSVMAYSAIEYLADTCKIQGEIEAHTEVRDILKTDGRVCIKDSKMMGGKLVIKGVLDLFILFTPEHDPNSVESTSTAIPFTQTMDRKIPSEDGIANMHASVFNLRTDVETDNEGKNCIISATATILSEGEIFQNKEQRLLIDIYSNDYPLSYKRQTINLEKMVEQSVITDQLTFELPQDDGEELNILQALAYPMIQRMVGKGNTLSIEGNMGLSVFFGSDNLWRGHDKSFSFTLKHNVSHLEGNMRCEAKPNIMSVDWERSGEKTVIKVEIACNILIFERCSYEVIQSIEIDEEHPLESPKLSSLIVYFADKGERLWDIARHFATTVDSLRELNHIDTDMVEEKQLILIGR